jgi:rhomboid family protein
MGLYDREYYREEPRGLVLGGETSITTLLILINAAILVADALFANKQLSERLALPSDLIQRPYLFWTALTYGFAHDPNQFVHVFFNMFSLWLFGRDVESIYGRRLYLQLYLSLVILSGLAWMAIDLLTAGDSRPAYLIGASGAVTGIMVVFVLHYPTRTFNLWGVVPVPVWLLATLQLVQDIAGTMNRADAGNVAYTCRLAGAAFGFLFYKTGWQLGSFLPGRLTMRGLRRRPKLKVRDAKQEDDLNSRVDDILEKISREGEASLTRDERRTLEKASRQYQQKRR